MKYFNIFSPTTNYSFWEIWFGDEITAPYWASTPDLEKWEVGQLMGGN